MRRTLSALVLAAAAGFALAADDYKLGPDSQPKPDVPKGTVTKFTWDDCKAFPGTTRECWLYVPAQYKLESPASLMVFQDGGGYQNPTGSWRVPVVFDNLIASGEMPVTVGLFINPGVKANKQPNRSVEYDTVSPQYASFLIDEMIPHVEKTVKLRNDPLNRAICGRVAVASARSPWRGSGRTSFARC